MHPGRCGQILQVLSFDSTQESTHGHGNGGANLYPRVQVFRHSRRYCIRPWTSVNFQSMEELCPGNWSFPANLLPCPPALLEPVYWLGRVCPELASSTNHWTHSLPVRARFPATFVPLGQGTIRCTCSRLLVPREGLGRSTPPSLTSYGQAQIDSRPSIRLSSLPTWSEGLAVHTGHQIAPIL